MFKTLQSCVGGRQMSSAASPVRSPSPAEEAMGMAAAPPGQPRPQTGQTYHGRLRWARPHMAPPNPDDFRDAVLGARDHGMFFVRAREHCPEEQSRRAGTGSSYHLEKSGVGIGYLDFDKGDIIELRPKEKVLQGRTWVDLDLFQQGWSLGTVWKGNADLEHKGLFFRGGVPGFEEKLIEDIDWKEARWQR